MKVNGQDHRGTGQQARPMQSSSGGSGKRLGATVDGRFGTDEVLSPSALSPVPRYGREASLSLEILDYGDADWDEGHRGGSSDVTRPRSTTAAAAAARPRGLSPLLKGNRAKYRSSFGSSNGGKGSGILEILDPEPFVPQEDDIYLEDQDLRPFDSADYEVTGTPADIAEAYKRNRDTSALGRARVAHRMHQRERAPLAGSALHVGIKERPGLTTRSSTTAAAAAELDQDDEENEAGGEHRQHRLLQHRQLEEDEGFGTYQYDDHGVTVTSDEENDIVKQIRHEITKQLKEDMKDELAVYRGNGGTAQGQPLADEGDEMPQELKEAIIEMRKYDRILRRKVEREKEVKRQRIQLQKRLREELASLEQEVQAAGRGREPRDVRLNADRFLSLAAPPPAGTSADDGDDGDNGGRSRTVTGSVTPVFATQLPDSTPASSGRRGSQRAGSRGPGAEDESPRLHSDAVGSGGGSKKTPKSDGTASAATGASTAGQHHGAAATAAAAAKKKGKDFVKRNIELAGDAGNVVAMTDDEKRRLEELLVDLDLVPDDPVGMTPRGSSLRGDGVTSHSSGASSRPHGTPASVLTVSSGGYSYEAPDADRMADIDRRLQQLMAPETWRAITAVPYNDGSGGTGGSSSGGSSSADAAGSQLAGEAPKLFTRTQWGLERDIDAIGEPALKDTHEEREVRHRLQHIETRLAELAEAPSLDLEMETPRLSAEQLQSLLEQCVRAMSLASYNAMTPSQTSQITYTASLATDGKDSPGATDETLDDGSSASRQSSEHGQNALIETASKADDGGESSSSWSLILDNPPPPLPHEMLQYLLEQARREGVGRRPSTVDQLDAVGAVSDDDSSDDDTIVDDDVSAAAAPVEQRNASSSSRLFTREQAQALGLVDGRTSSSLSSSSIPSEQQRQRLPPLHTSADSPFLVQRYA